MYSQNQIFLYQQQNPGKPVIEKVIPIVITDGAKQKLALDFVAWLRENKMQPKWRGLIQSWAWKADYKGKTILGINISENGWDDHNETSSSWFVIPFFDLNKYTETIMNENWQSIIQNNQCNCVHKNRDGRTGVGCDPEKSCAGGMTKTVFGKDIEGLCCFGGSENLNTRFYDPGETEIDCMKKLLELEQEARDRSEAFK